MSGKQHYLKPKLIILIRHGESESNYDQTILLHKPFHKIGLTDHGFTEVYWTGVKLLKLLNSYKTNDQKLSITFHSSPYCSTRQTLKCILDIIDEYNQFYDNLNIHSHKSIDICRFSPCKKRKSAIWPSRDQITQDKISHNKLINYQVREDPRLREQDIGNISDINNMNDLMNIRDRYGEFFYRFPQGENAADVYNRVANFQASLFRTLKVKNPWNNPPCSENPFNVSVIISHEIFIKAFLMMWFKWTFEEFETLDKIPNGKIIIMEYDKVNDHYELKTDLSKIPHQNLTSEQQTLYDHQHNEMNQNGNNSNNNNTEEHIIHV